MSSHHNQRFFNTFSRQRENARTQREQRRADRQRLFEARVAELRQLATAQLFCQYCIVLAWLAGIAAIVASGIRTGVII